jgi:prevent-host-death family protein
MTISATHFKARCLELMTRVDRTGRPVTITKRGKPIACLMPVSESVAKTGGGIDAAYGFARTFRRPRSTAYWMNLLREGERE